MNYPSISLVLVVTGFLAAAQSSPTPPSQPHPQEEALRLVAKGQFAEARHVVQPERHPHMIKFLSALATSRLAQRDYREAGILSEQALQMSRDIFGTEHPHVIAQMYEHAQLLKATRRGKEAAALKREADRIRALRGYSEPDRHRIEILALGGRY